MGFTLSEFKYIWPLRHSNSFVFNPSPRDFSVEEVPLYEFSGDGEHLVVKIRKKNLTTWQMLDILSNTLGVPKREFGYAGLKDKHAITMQYISMPKRVEQELDKLVHPELKVLEKHYHNNKIRVGHLKGNKFWLRFKKVQESHKTKIESVLKWIKKNGMPNYFGVQRFGNAGDNHLEGKALVEGKLKIRDRKKREFLISAYQSYLFNNWLAKRIELSTLLEGFKEAEVEQILKLEKGSLKGTKEQENWLKLLDGDLFMHYPFGKIFYEELDTACQRFIERDISPTGLIAGKKAKLAQNLAEHFEKEYNNTDIKESGTRRYAWIFPEINTKKYIPQNAHYELGFYLPKGCYATGVVDFLRGKEIE